ncbi:MAG: hypothetical protein ABSD47_07080 [Candidatus Methylomirabilota bacterium]|jgi:hypothetical protein
MTSRERILGVADNRMLTSPFERVQRISDLVERHGTCPGRPY